MLVQVVIYEVLSLLVSTVLYLVVEYNVSLISKNLIFTYFTVKLDFGTNVKSHLEAGTLLATL